VVGPALAGVVIPKVDGSAELARAALAVASAERAAALPEGRVRIIALIESARGLVFAGEVAGGPRVEALALGEGDLAADLGVRPSPGEPEFMFARSTVVAVSAAFGLEPPIGPVSTNFRDLEEFRASTEAVRRLGFGGRQAIHPAQVQVVNRIFRPGPDEVDEARATVTAYERAVADGVGVVLDEAGRMVDEAVVRSARRTLALADREGRGMP
jgi:citrate lyase subunit beta/citryl-CoA lyase